MLEEWRNVVTRGIRGGRCMKDFSISYNDREELAKDHATCSTNMWRSAASSEEKKRRPELKKVRK